MAPSDRKIAHIQALTAQTRAALQTRDFGLAEISARQIITAEPNALGGWLLLARALFGTERLDEALDAARRAVTCAPDQQESHLQVIITLMEMGRPEDALDQAESFLRADPASPDAAALHGLVLRRVGRLDEAVVKLEQMIKAHPGHLASRLWLAHALHDQGRNHRAAELYQGLIAQIPNLEEAHFGLSNTLADAGRLMEAAAAYGRAAQSIPGFNQRWPELLIPLEELSDPVIPVALPQTGGISMVLAFAPFELPSVPLGLATLKSYVESTSPHRITTVDMNARFFQALRRSLAAGTTPFKLPDIPGFLGACDFLSRESDDFYRAEVYEPAALTFEQTISSVKTLFTRQCENLRHIFGPVPWHARAMARALVASSPKVVGLSAMFDPQLPAVHALARAIKLVAPNVIVALGGGAFSASGIEPLLAAHYVDYVVLQDGEETLSCLLTALAAGEEPDLAGLCHRRADGRFAISDEARPIKQESVPPADFSDYDLGIYFNPHPVLPVLTSRGCYWRRCTFCNHFASYAGNYKAQSIDRVVDELEQHMARYGVRHFTLVDEMISAARFRKIGEEILARKLDVTYYALAKPTADFTPDILDVMYRSGCRYILWGQESGSERMLSMMDKGNTIASSHATLQASASAGLRNHLFLMVGYPTEGLAEVEDTIRFLYDNHAVIDQTQSGAFMLEKGTPLYSRPAEFGISKIFDRRSYGGCQLVRFEVASGLQPPQAEAAELALRQTFFPHFNPFSRLLGDFRDHALIIYTKVPRPIVRPTPPDLDQAMGAVRQAIGYSPGGAAAANCS